MSMSDWMLSKALPPLRETFQDLLEALSTAEKRSYVLAELNESLTQLTAGEFKLAVSEPPRVQLDPYWEN